MKESPETCSGGEPNHVSLASVEEVASRSHRDIPKRGMKGRQTTPKTTSWIGSKIRSKTTRQTEPRLLDELLSPPVYRSSGSGTLVFGLGRWCASPEREWGEWVDGEEL